MTVGREHSNRAIAMGKRTRREVVTKVGAAIVAAASGVVVAAPRSQGGAGRSSKLRAISEAGFVPIGGIDQWIAIQGQNIDNPIIVYLHGGPGEAQSPFLPEFRPWERHFTVLNWDQRGSGRTYGKYGAATPGMSTADAALERLTQDAIEVAEYACRHLQKRKVVIVGQSWGSMLALEVVKRRPDLFYAYVGTGFVANRKVCLQARRAWARTQASDMRSLMAGVGYLMSPSDVEYLHRQAELLAERPKSQQSQWHAGEAFTFRWLLPAVIASWDPRTVGIEFRLPVFVIQGRNDHVTSFTGAKAYAAEIQAPRKAFIPIDGGHFACFTDANEFVSALLKFVMPLCRD